MRVFISSTPEELGPYQAVAFEVVRELGMKPVRRDPAGLLGFRPVEACARQVAATDLMLAIVGHRRGPTPPPELGGDGLQPWSIWETRAAFENSLPVTVFMTSDTWSPELRENEPNARAVMRDFRGEFGRLATLFDGETEEDFRSLVRRQLEGKTRSPAATSYKPGLRLRRWPPRKLPERPYPMLLPYNHPDLMAGRDRELTQLRDFLALPVPIIGLHAPSGTGKSSLLYGGLVPALRAEGRPIAFDRHPSEPGIARRPIGALIDSDVEIDDEDENLPHTFINLVCAINVVYSDPI